MLEVLTFIQNHIDTISLIVTVLFLMSEALAQIPSIKANSVFQLIVAILSKLKSILPSKTITAPTTVATTTVTTTKDTITVDKEKVTSNPMDITTLDNKTTK